MNIYPPSHSNSAPPNRQVSTVDMAQQPAHHWQPPPPQSQRHHPHPDTREHLTAQQPSHPAIQPHTHPPHSTPLPPQEATTAQYPPPQLTTAQPRPPPPPPAPYMYAMHHQVITPVAHVPIGAAHYAHLPSSIWAPPHAQYHHAPPHAATLPRHVHPHVATATHLYAHPPSQPTPIPVQHASLHPSHHHHVNYQYVHHAPPTVKVPVSPAEAHVHQQLIGAYSAPIPTVQTVAEAPQADDRTSPHAAASPVVVQHVSPNSTAGVQTEKPSEAGEDEDERNAKGSEDLGRKVQNGRVNGVVEEEPKRSASESEQRTASQRQRSQQSSGQPMRKPRKPYTITKTREVWTPEEHARFVHALQLYDRDWKKIEAYIGTKTVLQIRSHAQKHFGKVTKYKTGEYIPPPRPKKRSALPYPRSRTSAQSKGTAGNGTNSDSGGASENGSASASGGGTNGHSSETLPGMLKSSQSDEHVVNGRVANSVSGKGRVYEMPKQDVPNPMLNAEKNGIHTPPRHYYNAPLGSAQASSDQTNSQGHARIGQPHPANMHPISSWSSPQAVPNGQRNLVERYSSPSVPGVDALMEQKPDNVASRENYSRTLKPADGGKVGKDSDAEGIPSKDASSRVARQASQDRHDGIQESSLSRNQEPSSHGNMCRSERMSRPNNSLEVLSDCVDMMSRDNIQERHPAAGWAAAAAARRAHRAKVIRARKPPLPSIPSTTDGDVSNGNSVRNSEASTGFDYQSRKNIPGVTSSKFKEDRDLAPGAEQRVLSPPVGEERSTSPPSAHQDEANRCSKGPRRSLENRDVCEEEPKSSNDGSGDDVNRASPPTRDSSPADPNSSGSRENTPNGSTTENNGDATNPPNPGMHVGALGEPKQCEDRQKSIINQELERSNKNHILDDPSTVIRRKGEQGSYPQCAETHERETNVVRSTHRVPHSIQSLCSDVPGYSGNPGMTDLNSTARKRARSPTLNGTVHHAQNGTDNDIVSGGDPKRVRQRPQGAPELVTSDSLRPNRAATEGFIQSRRS